MLQLVNSTLHVDVLDPVADRKRLGPRFCGGGFIWQVHDRDAGPLLAGPEWPNPHPTVNNAQGLPESFRHSTTTGEPLLWNGATGLAPGAGGLRRRLAGGVVLTHPCEWNITRDHERIVFHTVQSLAGWDYELSRTLALRDRTLVSISQLANQSSTPLVLEWFAHPFFALAAGRAEVLLPMGASLRENPGYALLGERLVFRRPFAGEHDGHLDHVALPAGQPLTAVVSHPKIGYVRFATDFAPFKTVVWANGNTVSLEPFLALSLAPGESRRWQLTYEFGRPD